MSKSIISNERYCLVCGTTENLHKHHLIYGTGKRQLSEKYGLWCYLCYKHHNGSNEGVHFNKQLDLALKEMAQRKFNEVYPDLDWLQIFGRNYL